MKTVNTERAFALSQALRVGVSGEMWGFVFVGVQGPVDGAIDGILWQTLNGARQAFPLADVLDPVQGGAH